MDSEEKENGKKEGGGGERGRERREKRQLQKKVNGIREIKKTGFIFGG